MDDLEITWIEDEELPYRAPPLRRGHFKAWGEPDAVAVAVICVQPVIKAIESHAKENQSKEIGGMLLGDAYQHEGITYIDVTECIPAQTQSAHQSSSSHLNITPETWAEMLRIKDRDHDHLRVVGWYHSHPDHGVFLSRGMDDRIQKEFFNQPWQTAMVYDPKRHEGGFFIRLGSQIVLAPGFFELFGPDYRQSVVTWRNLSQPGQGARAEVRAETGKWLAWLTLLLVGIVLVVSILLPILIQQSVQQFPDALREAVVTSQQERSSLARELQRDADSLATAVAYNALSIEDMAASIGAAAEAEMTQEVMTSATYVAAVDAVATSVSYIAQTQSTQVALMSILQTDIKSLQATLAPTFTPTPTDIHEAPVGAAQTVTVTVVPNSTATPESTSSSTIMTTPTSILTAPMLVGLTSDLYIAGHVPRVDGVHEITLTEIFSICLPLRVISSISVEILLEFEHQRGRDTVTIARVPVDLIPGEYGLCVDGLSAQSFRWPGVWMGRASIIYPKTDEMQRIPLLTGEEDTQPPTLLIQLE